MVWQCPLVIDYIQRETVFWGIVMASHYHGVLPQPCRRDAPVHVFAEFYSLAGNEVIA